MNDNHRNITTTLKFTRAPLCPLECQINIAILVISVPYLNTKLINQVIYNCIEQNSTMYQGDQWTFGLIF